MAFAALALAHTQHTLDTYTDTTGCDTQLADIDSERSEAEEWCEGKWMPGRCVTGDAAGESEVCFCVCSTPKNRCTHTVFAHHICSILPVCSRSQHIHLLRRIFLTKHKEHNMDVQYTMTYRCHKPTGAACKRAQSHIALYDSPFPGARGMCACRVTRTMCAMHASIPAIKYPVHHPRGYREQKR